MTQWGIDRRDLVATPAYRATLRKRYESPGWGASGYGWALVVTDFALEIGARSILDYGCGRGTLRPCLKPDVFDVREYDPGILGKDDMPGPADLVVATDVLEHIEPALLDNVLAHMRALALRGLFLNIATGPAKETLPDGRNAHLIQEGMPWWTTRLTAAGLAPARCEMRKGACVWVTR